MNAEKTGALIKSARISKGLTQKQLADAIFVTDKAICKWEKGHGCPDITLLPALSKVLELDIQSLLKGEITKNNSSGGNMNKLKIYRCPECGNLSISTKNTELSCCGKKLEFLTPENDVTDSIFVPQFAEFDGQYTLHFDHPMTKEDYIANIINIQYDRFTVINLFAQQEATVTIPQISGVKFLVVTNRNRLIQIK